MLIPTSPCYVSTEKTILEEQEESEALLNREYMKALGGFMLLLDDGGDIMFISEHVSKVLGLNQVS